MKELQSYASAVMYITEGRGDWIFTLVLEEKYLKCHFTFWYISALSFARWKNPSCLFFCLKPSQDPVPRFKWHLREFNFCFSDPGAGGVWWQCQVNSHPFDSLFVTFLIFNVTLIVVTFLIFNVRLIIVIFNIQVFNVRLIYIYSSIATPSFQCHFQYFHH